MSTAVGAEHSRFWVAMKAWTAQSDLKCSEATGMVAIDLWIKQCRTALRQRKAHVVIRRAYNGKQASSGARR